jgi:hypothetical protein
MPGIPVLCKGGWIEDNDIILMIFVFDKIKNIVSVTRMLRGTEAV